MHEGQEPADFWAALGEPADPDLVSGLAPGPGPSPGPGPDQGSVGLPAYDDLLFLCRERTAAEEEAAAALTAADAARRAVSGHAP